MPTKRAKPAKPKAKKVTHTWCLGCAPATWHRVKDMTKNENGAYRCAVCVAATRPKRPTRPRKHPPRPTTDVTVGWYVLACEPDAEARVKKDMVRKVRIEGWGHLVKRLVIPKTFKELVVPVRGETVEEGRAADQRTANVLARRACFAAAGLVDGDPTHDGTTPGFRYVVFRGKGKEKHKEGNDWQWAVKTVPPDKERKVVKVRKYPGYIVCQMAFCPETESLVKKTRGAWHLLLQPVVDKFKLRVNKVVRDGEEAYRWRVVVSEADGEVVGQGVCDTQAGAKTAGEACLAKHVEFKPTALESQEAAELLIQHKAVQQISRDKAERDRAVVNVQVKDHAVITDGVWKGKTGPVIKIDKTDPTAPMVTIQTEALGVKVDVSVPHYMVERSKK